MGRRAKPQPGPQRVPLQVAEIEAAFRRRVRFIRQSSAAFDEGDTDEAIRIATELRALLYGGSSPSVMHQLGVIKRIGYFDSVPMEEPGTASIWGGGLTIMELNNSGGRVVPRSFQRPRMDGRWVSFSEWWTGRKVVTADSGGRFNRSFLVKAVANQMGAHTDSSIDADLHSLMPAAGSNWTVDTSNGPVPLRSDVASASVRQIAEEFLVSVRDQLSGLLAAGDSST